MFTLDFPNLILAPLAIYLAFIFCWWFYYKARGVVRAPGPVKSRMYRCAICEHVYMDARNVPLSRCSRCGCLNEAVKR